MLRRHRCRFSRAAVFAGTETPKAGVDVDVDVDVNVDTEDAVEEGKDLGTNAENKTCEGPANESIVFLRFKDPS